MRNFHGSGCWDGQQDNSRSIHLILSLKTITPNDKKELTVLGPHGPHVIAGTEMRSPTTMKYSGAEKGKPDQGQNHPSLTETSQIQTNASATKSTTLSTP